MKRLLPFALFSLCAPFALTACTTEPGEEGGEDAGCAGEKCDNLDGALADLEGRNDPIANWLREYWTANPDQNELAEIDGNDVPYLSLLDGVSRVQDCGPDDIKSFIISDELIVAGDGEQPFPRVINTLCSSGNKVDEAFFALSFPNDEGTDVDTGRIEMYGWDPDTREYRFYKTEHSDAGGLEVTIDPPECKTCHRAIDGVMQENTPMTPIMNELFRPWENWFSNPNPFKFEVSDEVATAPEYSALVDGRAAPANELEIIITQAMANVSDARVRQRRETFEVGAAMDLLKPLFCAEQLQYLTEDGGSGLISTDALFDGGLIEVYNREGEWDDLDWTWLKEGKLNLPQGAGEDEIVSKISTRGEAAVMYEASLMARRAVDELDILRIRTLDWQHPDVSDFKCDLWESARGRMMSFPPTEDKNGDPITEDTDNRDVYPVLVNEILTLTGDVAPILLSDPDLPESLPLVSGDGDRFIIVPSFYDGNGEINEGIIDDLAVGLGLDLMDAVTCAEDGFCLMSMEGFGSMLEDYKAGFESEAGRTELITLRDQRAQIAATRACARPFLEGFTDVPQADCM